MLALRALPGSNELTSFPEKTWNHSNKLDVTLTRAIAKGQRKQRGPLAGGAVGERVSKSVRRSGGFGENLRWPFKQPRESKHALSSDLLSCRDSATSVASRKFVLHSWNRKRCFINGFEALT